MRWRPFLAENVVRRRDVHARMAAVVIAVMTMVGSCVDAFAARSVVRFAAVVGPFAVWSLVLAFAQKVTVDPAAVTVYSMFRVIRIPRDRVAAGEFDRDGVLIIHTTDRERVSIRSGPSWLWEPRHHGLDRRSAQLATAEALNALLRSIPPAGGALSLPVHRRPRWLIVAVAIACAATVASAVAGIGPTFAS